ncbi:RTA1-domain-containing protein [Cryphonectria parasitica EP155]|uniref:RTA1-domain-containing protein n=1 Tax=Cryphonectria parasitica (strain ATCC 38755 / EP155) TaxID=660469 RepID=A0A9P4Y2G0_CRYP1|nr:RTA1-domain-containing protein [Cryphonectria parasitica EP155]KAF3765132.1 RTA1-domain-containing protein [Cryphonectria parasitica EP155]
MDPSRSDSENMNFLSRICAVAPQAHPNCQTGFYGYKLSHNANGAFMVLFSIVAVAYICITTDQFEDDAFFMQICCLTIGPAFMAAAIYLCMRRIVFCFGEENSRISSRWFTRIFIPCDIVSLVLQATGGGLSAVAYKNGGHVSTGNNIMIAGLAFQVFTMATFICSAVDFTLRTYLRYKLQGQEALEQAVSNTAVRSSTPFRLFLAALIFATLCIFTRCCFRVAELSGGWTGPLMKKQVLFIVFESTMVFLASVALVVFHPGWCFKIMLEGEGGLGLSRLRQFRPFRGNRPRANAVSEGSVDDGVLQRQISGQMQGGEDKTEAQAPTTSRVQVPAPRANTTSTHGANRVTLQPNILLSETLAEDNTASGAEHNTPVRSAVANAVAKRHTLPIRRGNLSSLTT